MSAKGWQGIRLLTPLAFLLLFLYFPLFQVLQLATDGEGWQWLSSPYAQTKLVGSLVQASLSTLGSLILALFLAWWMHRRSFVYGAWVRALLGASFVAPVLVIVAAIRASLQGFGLPPLALVVLAHVIYETGFLTQLLYDGMRGRDTRLEEVLRSLGASPRRAAFTATWPSLRPTLVAGTLLVFLLTVTSFGVVQLLGAGELGTTETLLVEQLQGVYPRTERAAALGALQFLAATGLLLLVHQVQLAKPRMPGRTHVPVAPRAWEHLPLLGLLLILVAPFALMARASFRVRNEWTLEAWKALVANDHPWHLAGFDLGLALRNSLVYALSAATLSVLLAFLLSWSLRERSRGPWVTVMASLPLATSSVLVGFGMLLAFGSQGVWNLRGQTWLLVVLHALLGFPFALRILQPAMTGISLRVDDTIRTLGGAPRHVAALAYLPLLKHPLAQAWGLAAAISIGDYGASLLLMTPDTMGLSLWIARHQLPFQPQASAMSFAVATLTMGLIVLVLLLPQRLAKRFP